MKKVTTNFKIFLLVSICYLTACSKDESVKNDKTVNIALINEVTNLPRSLVTLGYANLNSEEKVIFWKNHVDNYLKDHPELSPALVEHIQELKKFARKEIWDNNSLPEMRRKIDDFEQNWFVKPIESGIFPGEVLVDVATIIGVGKPDKVTLQRRSELLSTLAEANCKCRYDIYCATTPCVSKPECAAGQPNNPGNCGVFGTSRCTGRCENVVVPPVDPPDRKG